MLKVLFVYCFMIISNVWGSHFLNQNSADSFILSRKTIYNAIDLKNIILSHDDLELFCQSSKLQEVIEIDFKEQKFLHDCHLQLIAENPSSSNLTKLKLENTKVTKNGLLSLVKSNYTGSTRFLKQYFIPRPKQAKMYFEDYNYDTASIPLSAIYVNASYKYDDKDLTTNFWDYPFKISFPVDNLNIEGIKFIYLNEERPMLLR